MKTDLNLSELLSETQQRQLAETTFTKLKQSIEEFDYSVIVHKLLDSVIDEYTVDAIAEELNIKAIGSIINDTIVLELKKRLFTNEKSS